MSAYTDIDTALGELLPSVDTSQRDFLVPLAVAALLADPRNACLGGSYAGLTGTNKTFFDAAAAYFVAFRLYTLPTSTGATGAVKKTKQGGREVEYDTSATVTGGVADWPLDTAYYLSLTCVGSSAFLKPGAGFQVARPVSWLPNANATGESETGYPGDLERLGLLEA